MLVSGRRTAAFQDGQCRVKARTYRNQLIIVK